MQKFERFSDISKFCVGYRFSSVNLIPRKPYKARVIFRVDHYFLNRIEKRSEVDYLDGVSNRQDGFATDSPVEEDGFELAVPLREGKGCGQPLRQALPFRA